MTTVTEPFKDVRVRIQAIRLLFDREQLVQNVFQGYGRIGNDMPCWFDKAAYPDVPQRTYDPEQAKSLLKAAGKDGLAVDLYTGNFTTGLLAMGTLEAAQAKPAGVTIRVHNQSVQVYYADSFMQKPYFSDYFTGAPYWSTGPRMHLKGSPVNEGQWFDPQFEKLFVEVSGTWTSRSRVS